MSPFEIASTDAQLAVLLLLVIEPIPLAEVGSPEVSAEDVALLLRHGFVVANADAITLAPPGLAYLQNLVNSKTTPLGMKLPRPYRH